MKKAGTGHTLSLLTGLGVFAALFFLQGISMAFSITGGIIAWLIVILLFTNKGDKKQNTKVSVDSETKQEIDNTIRMGRKSISSIRQAILRLSQPEVKRQVEELCVIADSILEMLRKDPEDLRVVKHFISHYLEPTQNIILKYAELATTRPMPADAIATLERTEKSLKTIRASFLEQKEKMLANDVIDLDTEIKVFETLTGKSQEQTTGGSSKEYKGTSRPQ